MPVNICRNARQALVGGIQIWSRRSQTAKYGGWCTL